MPDVTPVESVDARGPWPFVSRRESHRPGLPVEIWSSRHHRKTLPQLRARVAERTDHHWFECLWMPQELNWWIGGIFAVGAFLFMVASLLVLAPPRTGDLPFVLPDANSLYFAGSIPFTIAAYLQLWQAASNLCGSPKKWIVFDWYPSNPGWLSCGFQFVGTLLFNLNTWNGMTAGPSWFEQELWVWSPNLLGSVLFLASGHLAYAETCHAHWGWKPQSCSWWVVAINLAGCVFFMASAIFAFVLPESGEVLWPEGSVLFTLLGAAAFFIGAILMWPEAKWGSEP